MSDKLPYEELEKTLVPNMDDKALQNSLSLLETLIDTIPNPVFYKDKQGVYQGCNEAFANQIIGVTKEKIIGCSLFDLTDAIPSDLAEIYHQKDLELIENPGTQFYEATVQCADGFKRNFFLTKPHTPMPRVLSLE